MAHTPSFLMTPAELHTALRGVLQELVTDDTRAAAVGSSDGTLLQTVVKDLEADLTDLGPDMAALVKIGAYCVRKLEGGEIDLVSVATDRISVLLVALTLDHFLMVILSAGGNAARARLAIKKRRTEIMGLLS